MTREEVINLAKQARLADPSPYSVPWENQIQAMERFAELVAANERQAIADICDELERHWSDYKDTALLNDNVALSVAASGEPRAARAIKAAVLARGDKPWAFAPPETKQPVSDGRTGYLCVGGPLDGQLSCQPAGSASFVLKKMAADRRSVSSEVLYSLVWSQDRSAWVWRCQE